MIGFVILLLIMGGIWALLLTVADTAEISRNWPKYRCQASVIPFAAFYGHDTAENFQYCMTQIMNDEAGGILSPVFKILGNMLATLGGLMQVANSLRVEFATMMGGINQMFQNFADRFNQLQVKVKMTAQRMQMMMQRLYATFYALIFLSLSAVTALTNFSNTILFSFLDTFCFDPQTPVQVRDKGTLPISQVQIGDVLEPTGSRVTSTFQFFADGQPMVQLPGPIIVSTNHYIHYNGKVVRADEHPDSCIHVPWSGGPDRPLICLNTSDHKIPLYGYVFVDYDETETADSQTMQWIDKHLNAGIKQKSYDFAYTTVLDPATQLKMKNGPSQSAESIRLGDELLHGKVLGIVDKEVDQVCQLPSGEWVSPGQLYWDPLVSCWSRAIHTCPVIKLENPRVFRSFFIHSTAVLETDQGTIFRDYLEIISPFSEQFYAEHLENGIGVSVSA